VTRQGSTRLCKTWQHHCRPTYPSVAVIFYLSYLPGKATFGAREMDSSTDRSLRRGLVSMRSRFPQSLRAVAPLVFYGALSLVLIGRRVNWTEFYNGYATDSVTFVWFLHWWPYAITHGLNPFLCKFVWFPAGYNFAWATSVPLLSLLFWPITALGGPVLSYNILTILEPATAAWGAYLLGRELTGKQAASLICGAFFGFSVPEISNLGELNLGVTILIPLAVLLCVRRVRGKTTRRNFVILLSLVLTAEMGIATEFLAALCLMGVIAWFIFLLLGPTAGRQILLRLAVDVAIAAPLSICLTAPFLYYLLGGLSDVPTQIHPLHFIASEVLYFFVPVVPVKSVAAVLAGIVKQIYGYRPNYYTYISAPLLLIVMAYSGRHVRVAYVRALSALLFSIAVLSLGPYLVINGKFTSISLPWLLFAHIPIICSIVPSRVTIFFALACAVIAALWLAEADTAASRLWRFGLAGFGCLFLLPAEVRVVPQTWQIQPLFQPPTALEWTRWPVSPLFTPAHVRQVFGNLPNILLLPDSFVGPGMAWQVDSGMSFTQAKGWVGFTPRSEQKWMAVDDLTLGPLPPNFDSLFPAYCAAHRVDYILIGPGMPSVAVKAIEGLGWAHHMDNGIEVVKTPAGLF
jgi:hypothetical protein